MRWGCPVWIYSICANSQEIHSRALNGQRGQHADGHEQMLARIHGTFRRPSLQSSLIRCAAQRTLTFATEK